MNARNQIRIKIDKTLLSDLYVKQQKTLDQISIELGVSVTTVRNRLIMSGILRRILPKMDIKELILLYDLGWTLRKIGEKFGASRQAVHERLKRAGVPRRRFGSQSGRNILKLKETLNLERLRHLYCEKELPIGALVKVFGINWSNLRKILVGEGIEIRPASFYDKRTIKYPQLVGLEVGKSTEVSLPEGTKSTSGIRTISEKRGMKVSIRMLGPNRYRVSRVR